MIQFGVSRGYVACTLGDHYVDKIVGLISVIYLFWKLRYLRERAKTRKKKRLKAKRTTAEIPIMLDSIPSASFK